MAKKKAANAFVWIILLFLIVGLAGFGATNFGGSVQSVATVGSAEISVNDYARAVETQLRNFQRATGQQMTFQQARTLGLDRLALTTLVSDAALENEAGEIGLSVGDENVSEEIVASPAFHNVSGTFDRQTYELALRQNGLDVGEFETRVRRDVSSGLLRRAVGGGVEAPEVFIDTLFNFVRETRDVTWARLGADDLGEPLREPSEADLRSYYEANPEPFTRPETKLIRYAWLTPDMIVDGVEVEDDQVRALYDARLDEFVQPERRLVERLVFATEADAQAAKARLDAGEVGFDDLIEERGLSLADVDLGDVSEFELGSAADAVFSMEEPGIVGPLASGLGPALYRMNGILSAQETTYEEARDELAAEAAADRARRIIAEGIPQIEDLLAGGADFDALAERTDMETGSIEWNRDSFEGIAAYDAFRAAAEVAEPGGFPEVVELEDGGVFALAVDEVLPPDLLPLDDVRADVISGWEVAETEAALTARAESLAEEIRNGREMAGLDLPLSTNRKLGRDGFVDGTPAEFTDIVFDMEPDEIRILSADGDVWLVRLDRINAADATSPDAQILRIQFASETAREMSDALVAAYTRALLDETGVELNQSALNAVHAQLP
jgi:peptidyl-prolyl cis-trans isomerase D